MWILVRSALAHRTEDCAGVLDKFVLRLILLEKRLLPQPPTRICRWLAGLAASGFLVVSQSQIFVSEIMYHPVEEPSFNTDGTPVMDLYEEVHEFIELHNPGLNSVSLNGWKITGGIDFGFPSSSVIQPGQYLVVAKDKARLAAVAAYQLREAELFGPYAGALSNQGETIHLRDSENKIIDSVSYSSQFPWPISANAMGADEEWTGINPKDYQYRGRSLERVSFDAPSDDPANWLASPLGEGPSPGRPNSVRRIEPKPVVTALHVASADPAVFVYNGDVYDVQMRHHGGSGNDLPSAIPGLCDFRNMGNTDGDSGSKCNEADRIH